MKYIEWIIMLGSLVVSIISLIKSNKAQAIQNSLNVLEEKIKTIELEEKSKIAERESKAIIESSIINRSKGSYIIRVYNIGGAPAYNVNVNIQDDANILVFNKELLPFEELGSNKNFDICFASHSGSKHKFYVEYTWDDENGITNSNKELLSF